MEEKDFDNIYYDDEEYENEEHEDEQEEESEEEDDFDYEEFADRIKEVEDFNRYNIEYAEKEIDKTKASVFLDHVLVDIDEVKQELRNFIEARRKYHNEFGYSNLNSAEAWQRDQYYFKKAESLRNKLTLLAAGLTSSDLAEVADDNLHLVDDSLNEDGHQLRKELKSRMQGLNRYQREEILKKMLDDDHIDEEQFNMLRIEFL
jgi:hypothetical protein